MSSKLQITYDIRRFCFLKLLTKNFDKIQHRNYVHENSLTYHYNYCNINILESIFLVKCEILKVKSSFYLPSQKLVPFESTGTGNLCQRLTRVPTPKMLMAQVAVSVCVIHLELCKKVINFARNQKQSIKCSFCLYEQSV